MPLGKGFAASHPPCWCGFSPLSPEQAFHVVDQVHHSDLRLGPGQTDGAGEEVHAAVLLVSKDMLHLGPHRRFFGIGPLHALRHRPTLRLLAVNATVEVVTLKIALIGSTAIGTIGPDRRAEVALVEKSLAHQLAFIGRRIARRERPPLPREA